MGVIVIIIFIIGFIDSYVVNQMTRHSFIPDKVKVVEKENEAVPKINEPEKIPENNRIMLEKES